MSDKKKPSLEEFADQKAQAIHAENEAIARTNRVLRKEVEAERKRTAEALAERDAAEKALSLYEKKYAEHPTWLAPKKGKAEGTAQLVAVLSDTHYGEVVKPEEMAGYNKYDLLIAEQRTRRFFDTVIDIARNRFAGLRYEGIVLALGGDLVSGDIHDELKQTNAITTYETIEWVVPRLAAGIDLWRKEFGQVHVVSSPGNHGRDDKTPRYKGRAAHNADTHLSNLLPHLLSKSGDVTFNVPKALDAVFTLYEWNFGLEHGDLLAKNFSGSAEIGWLGPLIRGTNRKINAYAAEGKTLHYCVWGHGHQYIPVAARGAIGNGSLCGYNEFARGNKFRPEPPIQTLFVVDPKYGATVTAPVFVGDRQAEGW